MTIDEICEACINALRTESYNESTILNYEGVIRRFKIFCEERQVIFYTRELGKKFADDVISKKTGKFSKNRYHIQGRFYRLIDSYYSSGKFDFSLMKKGRIVPDNKVHQVIYKDYQYYLSRHYENDNTKHFYEYGMYCLLQFLNSKSIVDIHQLTPKLIIEYLKMTKTSRQREMLCELRGIFRYLKRNDLHNTIAGIHAPRIKKIIPVLTDSELENIYASMDGTTISLRDTAIVIIGLSSGIRACDLIELKLSNIDWNNETINFRQSKTGNVVCLPLTERVGNTLFRYITKERPMVDSDYLFLRSFAPYKPFSDHAACHAIVIKVFRISGIKKENRMAGMHMLRHNAASTMVKNEVPIETIAAILGHASPDTTDIYITTDVKKLKDCVLSMDGISKEVHHE
ncbi:MAG: tyrosine-type recombinase/integrase [Anaerovoracaceae bacterium]